jgi:hypothetical protein
MQLAEWTFAAPDVDVFTSTPTARWLWGAASIASGAASLYHGVKRNDGSVGWGLWWGLMGTIFPIITPIVAIASPPGFAKVKRKRK